MGSYKCWQPAGDLLVDSSLIIGNNQIKLIYLPDALIYSTLRFFHSKAQQSTKGHEYYVANRPRITIKNKIDKS
jgi:hypothetical protein